MVLTGQCLMVSWGAQGLGRVRWRVLRWVGCHWHPWLRGHGVIALVRRSGVAGWHTWRLRVRGVYHGGGRSGGHDRCKENPSKTIATPHSGLAKSGCRSAPLAAWGLHPMHQGSQRGGEGMGVLTTWPAAHLVEIAAGAGETDDDGDDREHKDGQADGYGCPKPAKEPIMTQGLSPLPRTSSPHPHHPQGHLSCQRRLWATQSNF